MSSPRPAAPFAAPSTMAALSVPSFSEQGLLQRFHILRFRAPILARRGWRLASCHGNGHSLPASRQTSAPEFLRTVEPALCKLHRLRLALSRTTTFNRNSQLQCLLRTAGVRCGRLRRHHPEPLPRHYGRCHHHVHHHRNHNIRSDLVRSRCS